MHMDSLYFIAVVVPVAMRLLEGTVIQPDLRVWYMVYGGVRFHLGWSSKKMKELSW